MVEDILNRLEVLDKQLYSKVQDYIAGQAPLKDVDRIYKEIRTTLKDAAKAYKQIQKE